MTAIFEAFVAHTANYNLNIQCAMSGDPTSKIAIIGEYPGENEVAFNRPFAGASGKVLWNSLRSVGINQSQCYVTNVVKRRVTTTQPVSHVEYTLWQEALQYELSLLENLELIILCGDTAMAALFPFEGITKFRGSVYEYNGIKCVIANNPAIVLRMPETEIIFLMDMDKAARVYKGEFREHVVKTLINPTFDEAMDYLDGIQRVHKKFATDIEVIGMETACIGVAPSAHEAMCIPFRGQKDFFYSAEQEYHLLRKFAALCDDPSTTVIAQNGNFDSYFMGYKDHLRFKVDFDTLLAHHTLYPRLPHNLGFLTAQYTDHPYYKDEKDSFKEGGNIDDFWRYNCRDCAITYAVADKEEQELKAQNLYEFFTTHVMRLHPHLQQATVDGIKVNMAAKERLKEELGRDVTALYDSLQQKIALALDVESANVNPNSPKQMTALFFDKLGCKAATRSTAAPIREGWLKDPRLDFKVRDVIIAVDSYSQAHKFYSTYVESQIDDDNRYRSEWKQFGVQSAPGRLSSGKTLWGSGGNSQNWPQRAYEMFEVDDPDCVFIYFDLSQAEARYVGWDANIEQWKNDFERARLEGGFDAHRALAATMFNTPYDEVPKKDIIDGQFTMRYIAKRCRHGLNYRMHIARLAQTTGLDYGTAARNYYTYHRINPELKVWWDTLSRTVRKQRMLFNSYGRRLFIAERLDDEALDAIVAFRPQSTIGDKTQRVWYQCHEDSRWDIQKARIIMNVHDALWAVAKRSYAKTALSIMKAYAEEPIMVKSIVTNKVEPMIIPADCKMTDPEAEWPFTMAKMKGVEIEAATI